MPFVKAIRNAIAWVAAGGRKPPKISAREIAARIDRGEISRLLIVRQNQKLGDALLATTALNALHARFPGLAIHWLASAYNAEALEGHPAIACLWRWQKSAWWRQGALWKALRRERFPLAMVMFSHTPSLTSFLMARAAGARWVYGFDSAPGYGGNCWSAWLANTEIRPPAEGRNESEKIMDLVRPLAGAGAPVRPSFHPLPEDAAYAASRWKATYGESEDPVVLLFPGGNMRRPDRLWPLESWVELARRLLAGRSWRAGLVGSPADHAGQGAIEEAARLGEFQRRVGPRLPIFSDRRLGRVAAFLRHARLFVCTDGGLFHLASVSGVPVLGLFISTDPSRWAAPLPGVSTLTAPGGRPERLSVEAVWQAVCARLGAGAAGGS